MDLNTTILEVARATGAEVGVYEHHEQFSLLVEPQNLVDVCRELRDNSRTQFDQCVDVTAVDWAKKGKRFEVVVLLYSIPNKSRVRIKVPIEERHPHCPSLCEVWESANWYEREAYDMYGIIFDGHPDLRRFYMPEDFVHPDTNEALYPLRKDFPLMGIPGSLPLPPFPEKEKEKWLNEQELVQNLRNK